MDYIRLVNCHLVKVFIKKDRNYSKEKIIHSGEAGKNINVMLEKYGSPKTNIKYIIVRQ